MTELDLAALERNAVPSIELVGQRIIRAGEDTSDPVGGFDAFGRLYMELVVHQVRRGSADAEIVFTLQHCDTEEGEYDDVTEFAPLSSNGRQYATIDHPKSFVRLGWATTGDMEGCALGGCFLTPASLSFVSNAKPVVSNAAAEDLLVALVELGLVVDDT